MADLGRAIRFYESRLGLILRTHTPSTASLGTGGARDLLVLTEHSSAPRVRGTTGLYHFALLVPSRRDLAAMLRRLVRTGTVLQGAADHGVSEALYLADPDGNGIEIYRDRAREEWPWVDGQLRMGTESLDLDELQREGEPDEIQRAPAGTIMGHVHLHVADLASARAFYVETLGFNLMQRYGPSALFVSAGGYHHHVGLNTWAGVGAPAPPPNTIGLRYFDVVLPTQTALDAVVARLDAVGVGVDRHGGDILVRDPSQNTVRLTRAA